MRELAPYATLVEFAREHREHHTLSVYAHVTTHDPASRRQWHVEIRKAMSRERDALARAAVWERTAFEACALRIEAALAQTTPVHGVTGWAWFVSEDGRALTQPLAGFVETSVSWRRGVRILPCLGAIAHAPAIVAIVDRERSRIYQLAEGQLTTLHTLDDHAEVEPGSHMGTSPRQGFHPGTRGETQRDGAQRRVREHNRRHVDAAAQQIATAAGGEQDVVLGGSLGTRALVIEALPAPVAARVVVAGTLTASTPEPEIPALATGALAAMASARRRELLHTLLDGAPHAGHGVFGLATVTAGAHAGAVDRLLVSATLAAHQGDAVEAVVQAVLLNGGDVEIVPQSDAGPLDAHAGGVAARMRFAASPESGELPPAFANRTVQPTA